MVEASSRWIIANEGNLHQSFQILFEIIVNIGIA